jgi:hypothetical protein
MAEKVTLKLTAAAAAFVRKDTAKETKLQAARGEVAFSSCELATLLFFLGHDPDPEVRGTAIKSLTAMPESQLLAIADSFDTHPKVLDMLARIHFPKQAVVSKLISHPAIENQTLEFLAEKGFEEAGNALRGGETDHDAVEDADTDEMEETEEVDEESEEFNTKYQLSKNMEVPEKVKMALIGDKEWRALLIKDNNKLVAGSVIKNPRITEPEILDFAKSAIQNDEIMRIICNNKEWLKNYQIRKALVTNCKTPLPAALRFMATLTDKDLAALAKSKNVSTVISTQARRLVLNKKKH